MEVGVLLNILWPWDRVERLARLSEDFGYDHLWFNDHPLGRDPFLSFLRLAPVLHRVRLGTATVNPSTRHPVVLAASAATLNHWTSGRFWLGLGSSTLVLLTPIGLSLTRRVQRCREAVLIIRQLLEEGRSTLAGEIFATADARLVFPERTPVPVLIGASGGPEMLRISGEVAHGIIIPAGNFAFYGSVIEAFRAAHSASGRADPPRIVAVGNLGLADDPSAALASVRPLVADALVYRAENVHSLRHMGITRDQALEWKSNPASIPDSTLREAAVVGTSDECVEGLERLAHLGITQFVLRFPEEATIRAVGAGVLPRLRARFRAASDGL